MHFFQFFLTYFRRKMGALSVTSLFLGERSFLVAILDIDEITVGKGAMVVSVWFSSLTLTSPALIVVTIVNGLVIIFCEFFAVSALFSCIICAFLTFLVRRVKLHTGCYWLELRYFVLLKICFLWGAVTSLRIIPKFSLITGTLMKQEDGPATTCHHSKHE